MPDFTMLKYFEYDHLPEHLKAVSKPFHDLAHLMVRSNYEDLNEIRHCLRKLLEAKDCAVRAQIK